MTHMLSVFACIALLTATSHAFAEPLTAQVKTARITAATPAPTRFVVEDTSIIDRRNNKPAFFRGMGYSPYLQGETPLFGAPPGDDARYVEHLGLMRELGVNYLHVFPLLMPKNFFTELDKHDLVYGQDIWVMGGAPDFLDEDFLAATITQIKAVIDHTYSVGRPERLVLFSIGDELHADAIKRTDTRHPEVRDFTGKHIVVSGRTPTEVALARLIDAAIDYELKRYGQRHLYCHTSWTHVGPLADRPDIEVPRENVLVADIGDLMCMNIYTYARGVKTSPPGSVTGTAYQGYLEQLAAGVAMPILITQVGLSTSPIEPKAWVPGFGGHRVEDVPKTFRSVWKDTRTAKGHEKFAGLVFFELQDEWWKSGEDHTDSTRHEPEDPEEWFGLYEVGKNNKLTPKGEIPETVRSLFAEP
ncbi:MAG TPA: hypothetical protein VN448_05280 [Gammaproteobacteria bacterium]|nr:hypothetical protein [Gammaproteobacteria bacterium]